ncbi:MAG TPA: sugar ABC transporter substrate-binding protein, partial [Amycolatopsis sp.]|nr:sugar ABC transporter substrate-binding protein [Amycolatopsis sp.]
MRRLITFLAATSLLVTGCAGAGSIGVGGRTLVIAIVSNPQMKDAIALSPEFEQAN